MAKFRSPFNTNELIISQTYHGESAKNPDDLSQQCAIDISKMAGSNVYSVTEGKVDVVSTLYGSYVSIIPTGVSFRIMYVHLTDFAVKVGQNVSKGQLIGKIRSLSTGSHLHFALKNISGKTPHPQPIDYFDRSLTFKTKYQSIKNIWFKGESFDWSKHKDLSYNTNAMNFKIGDKIEFTGEQNIRKGSGTSYAITGTTKAGQVFTIEDGPRIANGYTWYDLKGADWVADVGKWKIYVPKPTPPPEPVPEAPKPCPDCSKYKKEVLDLLSQIEPLERELEGQKQMLKEKNIKITSMGSELEEIRKENNNLTLKLAKSEDEKLEWMEKHDKLKLKLEEGKTNFIKQITDKIGEFLAKVLGGE